jgi:hypothetical protein
MKSSIALLKIRERLSKRDSQYSKNIKKEAIQESVNKAVLDLCRRLLRGKNLFFEQAEESETRVTDLQILISEPIPLRFSKKEGYVETEKIPSNFFKHIGLSVLAKKNECKDRVSSDFREYANAGDLLGDWTTEPSFDFDQSFHTIANDRIQQYHDDDFEVEKIDLYYYRIPKFIKFPNTFQPDGSLGNDDEWEFKEDFCELIIDEAVKIIAGDIESINQYQLAEKRVEENN